MSFRRHDAGTTLVEVIVALVVFSFMTTGATAGIATALRLVSEARLRETASNLAAEHLDRLRSVTDPKTIQDEKTTKTVSGTTFTIDRTADWKLQTTTVDGCFEPGNSSGDSYRTTNVKLEISWKSLNNSTSRLQFGSQYISKTKDREGVQRGSAIVRFTHALTGEPLTDMHVLSSAYVVNEFMPSLGGTKLGDATCWHYKHAVAVGFYFANENFNKSDGMWIDYDTANVLSKRILLPKEGELKSLEIPYGPAAILNPTLPAAENRLFPEEATFTIRSAGKTFDPVRAYKRDLVPIPATRGAGYSVSYHAPGCPAPAGAPLVVAGPGERVDIPLVGGEPLQFDNLQSVQMIVATPVGGCARGSLTFVRDDFLTSDNVTIVLPYGTWDLRIGGDLRRVTVAPPEQR